MIWRPPYAPRLMNIVASRAMSVGVEYRPPEASALTTSRGFAEPSSP